MEKFYERYWDAREDHLDDFPLKWPKLAPHIPREKYLKSGMGKRYLKNRLKRFLSLTG